jgi:serpin B
MTTRTSCVLAALVLCSMSLPGRAAVQDTAADLDFLVAGNTAFALDLYRTLAADPGNLFCSPLSVSTALAMTHAGARGETEAEMAAALRFPLPRERLHAAFGALWGSLAALEVKDALSLRSANGLWLERSFAFLDSYLFVVKSSYDAEFRSADFAGAAESARQEINAWTEERTAGRITDLVPPGSLTPETALVLVNAVWFKAAWAERFEKESTTGVPFRVNATRHVAAQMMSRTGTYRYAVDELAQIVELPYVGGRMSMVVVLPRAYDGLAAVEAALSPERLAAWTAALGETRVALSMPRFRVERAFSLNDALAALGMRRAFTDADFSGMAEGGGLFISEVLHKAFVDVDESGTEAAAATAVIMMKAAMPMPSEPVVFRADHPFLFLIRDRTTGSVLFVGRLCDPMDGNAE